MPGFLRNQKIRNILLQALFVAVVLIIVVGGWRNAKATLEAQHIVSGFGFLEKATGWDVNFSLLPHSASDPYWWFFVIGIVNTLFLDTLGLALATLIGGTIVVFWSFCVWLIPLLIGAGVWRHVMHKIPLGYVAALWSIVFPIGMFAVASINLGRVESLPLVESIGNITLIIAVVVWAIVFLGMLRHIVGVLSRTIRGLRS